ncbi:SOS response-associated peptidase family protein [Burkholderiaceae bacterium DAT-1]|nr:SOS response-associated peptidase family protein [Burkholderiaceae bacterium DAT-1]
MCTNYRPTSREELIEHFGVPTQAEFPDWRSEAWQDYQAPIILGDGQKREARLASYAFVPKQHIPPGVKRFSTMNARAETIGELRSYGRFWRSAQLCLVPMVGFYEPCYESGKAVRWHIGLEHDAPFAVAGLWREWQEQDGSLCYAFTQITINADDHPVMKRFHKPDDEKRSLVIVPEWEYDDWLGCRNPEVARSFLKLFPAEGMVVRAAALAPRNKAASGPVSGELF